MGHSKHYAMMALACAMGSAHQARAQDFTPIIAGGAGGSRTDVTGYLGLSFSFGANAPKGPQVVVGVQRLKVESDDSVRGLDLNARFGLDGQLGRVAVAGLAGQRDAYANLGFGYDFAQDGMFGTAALQSGPLRLGADMDIGTGAIRPYLELNSLHKPKRVAGGAGGLACATAGYVPINAVQALDAGGPAAVFYNFAVSNGLDLDGTVCVDAGFLAT